MESEYEKQKRTDLRRQKDIEDAITVRRESAMILKEVEGLLRKVERKLSYRRSEDVRLKIFMKIQEIKEIAEIFEDSESDPD